MELILTEAEKKAATWLELDDASIGKLVKASQIQIVEKGKEKVGDKEESIVAFWSASLILFSMAIETNADTFKTSMDGVTVHGKDCGNWELTIKRLKSQVTKEK